LNAREAIAHAAEEIGIRNVLLVLIEHADALMDAASVAGDKLLLHRAAKDHRELIQLASRVSS
jgi:hypothetical protein